MCLTLKTRYKTRREAREAAKTPLIAKKAIKVWKILRDNGISPYKYFKWEEGFHYYQEGKPFGSVITKGIFSDSLWKVEIKKGLHSFSSLSIAKDFMKGMSYLYTYKIVEMIIPKGSQYFLGKNGDIVSDNLIYPHE